MKAASRQTSRPALDLIEEAIHLLRTIPGSAFALYYLGTLPFILGLLYFWTDMARSPFASQHLAAAALGMSVLFLWMKFFQTMFARNLRAFVSGHPVPGISLTQSARVFIHQSVLQPTALFLLPLALL